MGTKSSKSESKQIMDLPNELIEKYVLVYLSSKDVQSVGKAGNARFKKVAENVLKRRSKSKTINYGIIVSLYVKINKNYALFQIKL